jgi:epoxyqueuosine reductase
MLEARERLRRALTALGFDEVRFAAVGPPPAGGLRAWLAAGYQADMHWLERTADRRLAPDLVLPGARAVIALGVNYFDGAPAAAAPRPVWARYATYSDYHDAMRPALARAGALLEEICGVGPGDYRWCVDTGPVVERGWAARAGLGFAGKNAMLISRRHGNWLFLAAILTRAALEPDAPLGGGPGGLRPNPGPAPDSVGLLCGRCTRCLDACPTQAFPQPGVLDSRRCISYQTIENRGVIPRPLRAGIGTRVYGCDLCLEVCPWNRFARAGRRVLLAARGEVAALGWEELLALTPERFAAVFRGTPIKRVKLAGLLRNACVAAGNSGEPALVEPLARLAQNGSPLVRVHAVWAVRRLAGAARAGEFLRAARAAETDPLVLEEYAAGAAEA